jgi:hypothetical protein
MPTLTHLGKSTRPNKKFVAIFDNPKKTVHFGLRGSTTYIDGADDQTRTAYLKRHVKDLESGDELKPGFLSYYITWGASKSLEKNIKSYLRKFDIKDGR